MPSRIAARSPLAAGSPATASPSPRRLALGALLLAGLVVAPACKSDTTTSRKGSDRAKWVDKPTSGTQKGKFIKIPGLQITFEAPPTLYVYKECREAEHRAKSVEGLLIEDDWIPVITCDSTSDGETLALTFFVSKDDKQINERAVAIHEADLKQAGFEVESVDYYDEYERKPGRRAIEIKVRKRDEDDQYAGREIQQVIFPKGDVIFIMHIDVAMGSNRAGVNSDWKKIIWNFQLDEDGPLYEGQGQDEPSDEEE